MAFNMKYSGGTPFYFKGKELKKKIKKISQKN